MYERFTDRARIVFQLANQEAQRFNHEYIGTEHILLGLIKEGSGVAANVLKNLDVDLRKIRLEVEKLMPPGPDRVSTGKLPQTHRAKRVIEFAIEEARNFNDRCVGTQHILLGLLREQEGVAAQVLINLGLNLEDVREEVLNLFIAPLGELEAATTKPHKEPMKETTYKCDLCRRQLNPPPADGGYSEGWALTWTGPGSATPEIGARLEPIRRWEESPHHLCQICVRAVHWFFLAAKGAKAIQPEFIPEPVDENP